MDSDTTEQTFSAVPDEHADDYDIGDTPRDDLEVPPPEADMIQDSIPQDTAMEYEETEQPDESTTKAPKAPTLWEIPQGKSVLPFSRVQRILKADEVPFTLNNLEWLSALIDIA